MMEEKIRKVQLGVCFSNEEISLFKVIANHKNMTVTEVIRYLIHNEATLENEIQKINTAIQISQS